METAAAEIGTTVKYKRNLSGDIEGWGEINDDTRSAGEPAAFVELLGIQSELSDSSAETCCLFGCQVFQHCLNGQRSGLPADDWECRSSLVIRSQALWVNHFWQPFVGVVRRLNILSNQS